MIPHITKGSNARAALAYDFGPGKRDEHVNPRTVAGNLPGDWRDQGAVLDGHAKSARPDVERHVWRTSLRAAKEDRTLTDEEWRQSAETFVKHMGFDDAPWTATRHGDDHIHITVSAVRWDGTTIDQGKDYARAQTAARAVEREHQLLDASTRYDRARPQVSNGERESAQRRGVRPERDQLREHVSAATTRSGGSLDGFDQALTAQGVVYKRNQASTGRVSGYSYGLAGHVDQAGEQVWFKGSQLGKDFTWKATEQQLTHYSLDASRVEGDQGPLAARPHQEHAPRSSTSAQRGETMNQTRPTGAAGPEQEPTGNRELVRRVLDGIRRAGGRGQGHDR